MPVLRKDDRTNKSSASSSASSSNNSSSSSDSSSSNDSSSDDSSSSDEESASSSASSPNKGTKAPAGGKPEDVTSTKGNKGVSRLSRSRSCSTASGRSRSQASLSSISSASSTKSTRSRAANVTATPEKEKGKQKTRESKNNVVSTTTASPTSEKPTATSSKTPKAGSSSASNQNQKGKRTSSTPVLATQRKSITSTTSGPPTSKVKSKGLAPSLTTRTISKSTTPTKKGENEASAKAGISKIVKSGTVTNTRTIKPLHSSSAASKHRLGSTTPGKVSQSATKPGKAKEVPVPRPSKGSIETPKKTLKTKKSLPLPVKVSPGTAERKSRPPLKQAVTVTPKKEDKDKLALIKHKIPAGTIRTRASSCSSLSASLSSSVDSSSAEDEPQESSVTESSPVKQKQKKMLSVLSSRKKKILKEVTSSRPTPAISSADEGDAGADDRAKLKKKQPHARRPVTRRQKSGAKKTIPTTTLFTQSSLIEASNATNSPTSSPRKPNTTLAILASSSSDGAANRLASHIISRRSTSNSSANSSETESTGSGRKYFSSLTTQSTNKNKYLSTWDSDFSDDNFGQHLNHSAANFIRVPAKTSNRPRSFDFSQSLLDPEMYEPPRCPFPSCDSSGHLSGKYPNHNFLSCCPRYHGFEVSECTENEQERSRRESERSRYKNILSTPGKKPPKQTSETKAWVSSMKELKESQTSDGLVSEYDSLLWKDALALAAEKIEKEQNEGINSQGVYPQLSMAVAMGRFEMKCWCGSPYPEPLSQNRRLFVCEFCLKPVASGTVLRRHCAKCVWRHPPGDEIYRKDRLSVWEVDGKKQKTYCQNLCLLAKCFLDHKTLYLDVDPFLFYVMTLADSQGCHLVGYFSKEKNSFLNYNVSCILTLPPYMRQGFGRLLIDFSYLLTRVEGKIGSPEKPLSDLGLISYRSYWKDAVLRRLCACASREINIKDLSIELGVSSADLISTLQFLGMLKYWKGKHLVLKKQDVLEEYLERVRRRGNERQIDSSCLRWRPYQSSPEEHSSSEKS